MEPLNVNVSHGMRVCSVHLIINLIKVTRLLMILKCCLFKGVHCERFSFKVQYKPLSQKMLEEPFWLGLICVAGVLSVLSVVYCIKKKFAERIEAFFAEEIERSKCNCEQLLSLIIQHFLILLWKKVFFYHWVCLN